MITWIIIAVILIAAAGVVGYLFGKFWLGWSKFKGHVRTIHWGWEFRFDIWHWQFKPIHLWYYGAPGFHFNSVGIQTALGPVLFGYAGRDTVLDADGNEVLDTPRATEHML